MAVRLHLFKQRAQDLQCHHETRWAGALDGSIGEHLMAMDCATCLSPQAARDELTHFALYVYLMSANAAGTALFATAAR